MNWRGWIALGWVLLILILLGGFAWLTQNPEAEILGRAREWPLIGPLADRFQSKYLGAATPSPEGGEAGSPANQVVVVFEPPKESLATQFVWVNPGTEMREQPDPASSVVHTMTVISNLPVLSQQGDWYWVSRPLHGFERQRGWVWLENYKDPSPEVLSQPDPVLPLPANTIDGEALATARRLMTSGSVEVECGSYPLITDAQDAEWLQLCARVTNQVDEVYRRRYGLEPVGPPAESILFFRSESSYEEFGASQGVPWELDTAHASASRGYLALCQGNRSTRELLGSLVHELSHLINRRALGPWLPPWLEEGIADDLGESEIDDEGSISPGSIGGETDVEERRVTRQGARAAAIELQKLSRSGELPSLRSLMELDRDQFYEPPSRGFHYALSSFWVRYLLSDLARDLAPGFRSFLARTAEGQPITSERFLTDLDTDWATLESGFKTWLHTQFLLPPSETPDALD